MGIRDLLNKFTAGELDPKFIAEVDYEGYRKAARKLRNVLCVPQGGVTRRFGTLYEQTIIDNGMYVSNPDFVRLIEYEHQNNNLFDIIIRPDLGVNVAFDIYLSGVFQVTVLATPGTYTATIIREIRWVKDYDRLILLHQQVPPHELRWIANNNWTLTPIQFQFFPTYDFTYSDDPATLPTPNTPYWTQGVTFTPNLVAATTLTASTAVFTSNHVGGLYYGNGGVFRITAINAGGTVATGFTLEDFIDTSAIQGQLSTLLERAWNDGAAIGGAPVGIARLWPSHGCFYQSRLVMGGSPALPGTVFASVVKAYYDFDDSDADPSSGWGVEIGVTGNDILQDILATKSLVLLSNKGPSSTSILIDTPTTPTNAFLNTQGTEGSRNMNSVIIDNQVIYADRAGNTIWSMSYEIPDTGYTISNASILSSQLIRGPRWADIFDPDDIDGRYYLLANSDGTLAIYNTILVENIKAWTLAQTTGSFVDVSCVANQCKFLIRRKVNIGALSIPPNVAYNVDSTFNAFRNITGFLTSLAGITVLANDEDYLLIGNEIPFLMLGVILDTPSSQDLNLTYEFLNNRNTWESFIPVADSTTGFTVSGMISWTQTALSNWQALPIEGTDTVFGDLPIYYWIRIKRNNSNIVTNPIVSTLLIDSEDRIHLEKASFTDMINDIDQGIWMDSQVNTTSDVNGEVTGLTQLIGQNIFVYADGFPLKTFYVPQTGTIDIEVENAEVWLGLDFTTLVVPMPTVCLLGNGLSVYEPAKVIHMYVDFYYSLGITVQGQPLPQMSPGQFLTQEVPTPQTDYYKIPCYNGWDARAQFIISQSYPAPFSLLAVSYTIEVAP